MSDQWRRGKHRKRWVGIIGTGKDRRRATLYTPQGDRIETDAKAADAAVKRLNQDTNDFNKLDESYKLTIWDNVPDSACFERLAVLSRPRPAHHLDHASRQHAPIENQRARAHRIHFSAEANCCTIDQGTLSRAAAVTRAMPAAVNR